MRKAVACLLAHLTALAAFWASPDWALAQWAAVGDGIEYRSYTVAGPNNVFVARMERANTNATIDSMIGSGAIYSGRETVRNQAIRYDDAINYWGRQWGRRNQVVVAINGDFFNTTTGVPSEGQIISGWNCKRFSEFGGWGGMVWTLNRTVFMAGCVNNPGAKQYITFLNTGVTAGFNGINTARSGSNDLLIYTSHYDSNTHTDNTGSEVLVELTQPMIITPQPGKVIGTVRQIRPNLGSTYIPFDHIVLSANGSKATTLLANVSVGSQIGITQEPRDYYPSGATSHDGCSTNTGHDWTSAYSVVGGNFSFLWDGYAVPTSNAGLIVRNPRTAVAYNDNYIYFIVVDGRSTASVGMTMTELATFCQTYLATPWGYNLDGGGSSTMVINGVVKNVPSDGSERTVANGLMMINVASKLQSTSFAANNAVKTSVSAAVRLGPGTNYDAVATLAADTSGTVLAHTLGGVYAKGEYWWKCDFGGTVGWVAESMLTFVSGVRPPTITLQPRSTPVGAGGSASFSVQATGEGTLTYRWQQNQANLSEGGAYAGVLTGSLTISPAWSAQAGAYRCVVTNAGGSVFSNEATLKVMTPDLDGDTDVDMADYAILQLCLGLQTTSQGCEGTDLNDDEMLNGLDVSKFAPCVSGQTIPFTPGCLQLP
jgi:hypothetical protein